MRPPRSSLAGISAEDAAGSLLVSVPVPGPARPRGSRAADELSSPAWTLGVPPELVEHLAELVAARVAERLPHRPEPFLDLKGAAKYLACPKSRVYELVERHAVAVHRDGRRLLFRAADLDAHLRREEAE